MRIDAQVKFAIVPEWVLFSGVSDRAVRLYGILARHANQKTGRANPTRETLRVKLKVKSVRTVDSALVELIDLGAITRKRRWSQRGDQTSNDYVVNVTPGGAHQIALGEAITRDTPEQEVAPPPVQQVAHRTRPRPEREGLEREDPPTPSVAGGRKGLRVNGQNPRSVAKRARLEREITNLRQQISDCVEDACNGFSAFCQRCGDRRHKADQLEIELKRDFGPVGVAS